MPKMHKDFPAQLSYSVPLKMRQELEAIGYMLGTGGQYAAACRNLLRAGINKFVGDLDARKRAEYDSILLNVQAREVIK